MQDNVRRADLSDMSNKELVSEIRRLEDAIAGFESICTQKNIRIKNLESENLELIEGRRVQAKTYDALAEERRKEAELNHALNQQLSRFGFALDDIRELGESAEALDSKLSQMYADASLTRTQLLAVIRAMLDIAGKCGSTTKPAEET